MSVRAKRAVVSVLGVLGLIMILLGALAHVYATTTGVIIAICCWAASGILARYWGTKEKKS